MKPQTWGALPLAVFGVVPHVSPKDAEARLRKYPERQRARPRWPLCE